MRLVWRLLISAYGVFASVVGVLALDSGVTNTSTVNDGSGSLNGSQVNANSGVESTLAVSSREYAGKVNKEIRECATFTASPGCIGGQAVVSASKNPRGQSNPDIRNDDLGDNISVSGDGQVSINLKVRLSGDKRIAGTAVRRIKSDFSNSGVNITLEKVSEGEDIVVGGAGWRELAETLNLCTCQLAGNVLGFQPKGSNVILFNRTPVENDNNVYAHEFGHLLGLSHRNKDIMSYLPDREITPDDVSRIIELYAPQP